MHWISLFHVARWITRGYTLASLISLQTLEQALASFGYPAVTLFIMIESAGIPFPGETMLLLASFYAAVNHQLQIPIVIACAALGAILGDNIGYMIGRSGGRAFITRFGRFLFIKPHHLTYAENFFAKHGGKTVFFGRFTTLLRVWSAFLAGVHHMHWRTFLVYNAAGGILWATFYGLLGYFAGRLFHDNFAQIERIASTIGWVAGGTILLVVVAIIIGIRWRRARHLATHQETAEQTRDADPVS